MKLRMGFVSNSSSASFVIPLCILADWQVFLIKNHQRVATEGLTPTERLALGVKGLDKMIKRAKKEIAYPGPPWELETKHGNIIGRTSMDNFDMAKFLEIIGVKRDDFIIAGQNWGAY